MANLIVFEYKLCDRPILLVEKLPLPIRNAQCSCVPWLVVRSTSRNLSVLKTLIREAENRRQRDTELKN